MLELSLDQGPPPVVLNRSRWPLAMIRVKNAPSPEVAREIRYTLFRVLELREPHACVVILCVSGLPTPTLVREQAQWFTTHHQLFSNYCRGLAFVTNSAALRGVPNAILRLVKTPMPIRAFADEDQACSWASERVSVN